jgi:hypothetical protein
MASMARREDRGAIVILLTGGAGYIGSVTVGGRPRSDRSDVDTLPTAVRDPKFCKDAMRHFNGIQPTVTIWLG